MLLSRLTARHTEDCGQDRRGLILDCYFLAVSMVHLSRLPVASSEMGSVTCVKLLNIINMFPPLLQDSRWLVPKEESRVPGVPPAFQQNGR